MFSEGIIPETKTLVKELGIDSIMPRQRPLQVHPPNVGGFAEKYYCHKIYAPYTDSLIQSLESRFDESNRLYFYIFSLHPREMHQTKRDEFMPIVSPAKEVFGIGNLVKEALVWYNVQNHKPLDDNSLGIIEIVK